MSTLPIPNGFARIKGLTGHRYVVEKILDHLASDDASAPLLLIVRLDTNAFCRAP